MSYERIDNIVAVSHKLAELLKDPTTGMDHIAKKEMSPDARREARDAAHDDLITCIDTLAAAGHYHEGYLEVINIAQRLHVALTQDDSEAPAAPT